eukprot:TRINITY_DN5253_c0_g1_i1.p1 TRINITY_DN5253_c0_g1~~TRINITY_DN5253_c0_g1_i1.p1  ORF type:complete len:286 (-),score=63.97 TRINITY_DN5253_c0_g1_i1:56-913(-)
MIPRLAFGTGTSWWVGQNGKPSNPQLVASVKAALHLGYRHIDTAEIYGTESDVGIAIREFLAESGLRREDLYIATKVGPGMADIAKACKESLGRLGLTYVDLFYIHSPFFSNYKYEGSLSDAWAAMEQLVDAGLTKQIAVSNYSVDNLKEFVPNARIKPVLNQVEYHPYLQQPELAQYCKEHGIGLASYGGLIPLSTKTDGPVNAVVNALAAKYGVSDSAILVKWNLSKCQVTVTTSSKEERLKQLLELEKNASAVPLTAEDLQAIDTAGAQLHHRQFWTKNFPN